MRQHRAQGPPRAAQAVPPASSAWHDGLGVRLVGLFLGWRVLVSGLLIVVYFSAPQIYNLWNFHFHTDFAARASKDAPSPSNRRLALPLAHWDGQHYLGLAQYGYAGFRSESRAFYPLLPLLTRLTYAVVRDYVAAAYVCGSVAAWLFLWFYCRLGQTVVAPESALRAGFLVLCFPSGFYLVTVYTEALFLGLLFGFLYTYQTRRSMSCLPFAFLLPLCRPQGLLVPMAVALSGGWQWWRQRPAMPPARLLVWALLAFALGVVCLLAIYAYSVGQPFAAFAAQGQFVFGNRLSHLVDPGHFLSLLLAPSTDWFAPTRSLVDRGCIVLMLSAIPLVWRLREPLWLLLYVALAVVPALMGEGGSYTRFALLAFPFVSLALVRHLADQPDTLYWLAAGLALLQGVFIYRFAVNLWVG